jgi:hypothetical protein
VAAIRPLLGMLLLLPGLVAGIGVARLSMPAAGDPGAAEACFAQNTNAARATVGLAAVPLSAQLAGEARAHSQQMATSNQLYHSNLQTQYADDWVLVGENVGTGPDCAAISQAFVNSPHHYENIVNPKWTRLGVGVVISENDIVWVTVGFEQMASAPPTPAAPAPAPASPAAPTTPAPVPVKSQPAPAPPSPATPKPTPAKLSTQPSASPPPPTPATTAPPPSPTATAVSASATPSKEQPVPTETATSPAPQIRPVAARRSPGSDPLVGVVGLVASLALSFAVAGGWARQERRRH